MCNIEITSSQDSKFVDKSNAIQDFRFDCEKFIRRLMSNKLKQQKMNTSRLYNFVAGLLIWLGSLKSNLMINDDLKLRMVYRQRPWDMPSLRMISQYYSF